MEPIAAHLSALLRSAEATSTPIPPLTGITPGDVDSAYAVQRASIAAWQAAGRRLIGHKIGLTNPSVQAQLGVDRPDFGALFTDMRYESGCAVPITAVLQPRVEAEMAFTISADIDDPGATLEDVAVSVSGVHAAIEIVGSRIAEWRISIVDTVADNASSGAFVVAANRAPLSSIDLTGATMTMTRTRGDVTQTVSEGTGADCLGSPLIAAHWLARELARRGSPIRAGATILTGALGPMVPVAPGDSFAAYIDGLGEVTVKFSR